jgi:hypothetical protein
MSLHTMSVIESPRTRVRRSLRFQLYSKLILGEILKRVCVRCGNSLRLSDIVPVGPFKCRNCGAELQVSEAYAPVAFWAGILLSVMMLVAIGLRGAYLIVASLLAAYPVTYLGANYLKYVVPPKIESYLPKDATLDLSGRKHGPK